MVTFAKNDKVSAKRLELASTVPLVRTKAIRCVYIIIFVYSFIERVYNLF